MIALLVGFLAACLIFLAWVAKKLIDLEKRLDTLQRVGFLVTGDQQPLTSVHRMSSRRELIRRIEAQAAAKGVAK